MLQSNVIVKGVLLVVGLVVFLVIMKSCNRSDTNSEARLNGGQAVNDIERESLGVDADSPETTVATLISQVKNLRENVGKLSNENSRLSRENKQLTNMENTLTRNLEAQLKKSQEAIERKGNLALEEQERKMQRLLSRAKPDSADNNNAFLYGNEPNGQRIGDTFWVAPLEDGKASSGFKGSISAISERLTGSGSGSDSGRGVRGLFDPVRGDEPEQPMPYFTIAKNSTLVNSTAMTSLIGRVPIGGNVQDPYFFKAIVGRENLIANGHELPEVAYAIVSGEAFGDWTLSCVRGKVYSMTFVFHDGTIRTVPKPEDVYESESRTKKVEIGELSDAYGNPCVPGKKKSNAGKYLAGRIAANAAEAASIAAAASETTRFDSSGNGGFGSTTVVTGNRSKFIYDATLAGAARETADWIRERQSQEFDAIYVKAGEKVAIHVKEEITLDYDPLGRKTNYHRTALRGAYRELD
ncbi:MAG: TIGR03752 family integrating conjugative element protein [Pseudomonadota bacterium]